MIVQTVSVKDKDGKPIEGLTAKDFIVTEDGEPQTISFVEFQRCREPPPRTRRHAAPPAARQPPPCRRPPDACRFGPSPPGDTRYRDRRLLVLYFDLTRMPPADQMRAYAAALKFIDTQMQPSDLRRDHGLPAAAPCA